ncbi:hypothetical protein B0T25DRAFT_546399 [Lasiosphaeria hispida]|uniref:Uncharacterized protein n=1 Tax=Lasiosphaeria hispida TaxID=260671 RepID=A0AAJ0HD94_9PEZI|nr:hypothetical protein B0T25DRAFT_546399 [Lasiosphaeria hispida]
MECASVGEANADIAGLGIVVALAIQGGISVILSAWLFVKDPSMRGLSVFRTPAFEREADPTFDTRIEAAKSVLRGICDSQIFAGTALLIAAFVTQDSLTLYHYHIIYDITNFTAVSFCAALLHVSDPSISTNTKKTAEHNVRIILSAAFSVLHLTFSIFFGRALERWDWNIPGRCYNTRLVSHSTASHPYVDKIYLGITCFYMQGILILSLANAVGTDRDVSEVRSENSSGYYMGPGGDAGFAVMAALLQYPLHLYSTVALRTSNEGLLEGDSENNWGFGQVMALVLVVDTFIKCGLALHARPGSSEPNQAQSGYGQPGEIEMPQSISRYTSH